MMKCDNGKKAVCMSDKPHEQQYFPLLFVFSPVLLSESVSL